MSLNRLYGDICMPMKIQKNEQSGKNFKIKTIWGDLRNNCIKIEEEKDQQIDKQIVPVKTKNVAFVNTCHKLKKYLSWN